jgi:hypothetical protein
VKKQYFKLVCNEKLRSLKFVRRYHYIFKEILNKETPAEAGVLIFSGGV